VPLADPSSVVPRPKRGAVVRVSGVARRAGRWGVTHRMRRGILGGARGGSSGERAAAGRGGSVGWPGCARILRTTTGSVSCAMRRRGPLSSRAGEDVEGEDAPEELGSGRTRAGGDAGRGQ
jgi:hypothetical protein